MKHYFNLFLILTIALFSVSSAAYSAAKKVVLLEQFTGAWCGFCVDGTVIMDDILSQYPQQVIGVKFHNGDKMEIPETNIIGTALGLTGYPTGNVDRAVFNVNGTNKIFIDRGAWKQAVVNEMSNPGIADLKLQWTYDASSNKILANITAKFDQNVSSEIRFNVYVVEDDVTGTGTGWDQHNYYSKDNPGGPAGSSSHPYYNLPPTITGYHHMKVVRATLGGPWGQENSIPTPVAAGATVKYSFEIAKSANWNLDKVFLVGLVQNYNTNVAARQVINSVLGEKVNTSTSITTTGDKIFAQPTGSNAELNVQIKNNGSSPKEYSFNLSKSPSSKWKVSLEPSDNLITIPAGGSYSLKLRTNVESLGSIDSYLSIEETDGMSFGVPFKGYSSDAQMLYLVYDPNNDAAGLGSLIRSSSEYSPMINVAPGDFQILYSKFNDVKLAVYYLGDGGALSANDNLAIQSVMSKGNLFLAGSRLFYSLTTSLPSLENALGIKLLSTSFQGYSTGKLNIAGINADPISDGFSSQLSIYYLLSNEKITNPIISSPVVTLQGNADSVFATKTVLGNSHIACFGFDPMKIATVAQRDNLVKKALKWVYTAPDPELPEISTPTGIDFGEVETNSSFEKQIEIKNVGKKDLVISSVSIVNNSDNAYTLTSTGDATIKPNGSTTLSVKFSPTAIKFYTSSSIEINSNDPVKPKVTIQLAGKGKKPSSVDDLSNVNFSISPNPVINRSIIKFNIPETARTSSLKIINVNGKEIMDLNDKLVIGENNITLNNDVLPSGIYMLILNLDGEVFTQKFTIIK